MSKIGKKPINIPKDSSAIVDKGKILLKGPKGSAEVIINDGLLSTQVSKENQIIIKPIKQTDEVKKVWGTTRSLINSSLIGVTSGFEKILEMTGVGYRAALKGDLLNLQLGYSHDVNFKIPPGVKLSVEKQTVIKIAGTDKAQVGRVVSKIKSYRKTEPYKGKGIKERGQYVLRKEGKKK